MSLRILVTGGGGFIGNWVCRLLRERGDEAVGFQRHDSELLRRLGIEQYRGDLLDAEAVVAAARGCHAVIHTAGKAGAWGAEADYQAVNVSGTEHVLAACRQAGVQRLVFTSSPSVVHGGGDIEGGDESLPYPDHFAAPYPRTKALAEQRVMAANGTDGLRTVSLRPHLVWGPGDNHLLPRLLERAGRGALRLPGADKLIDTVYIENAAAAHLQALDALDANPACHGKTYFISNGEPWPQRRIIAALLGAAGAEPDIRPMSPAVARAAGAAVEGLWRLARRRDEPPITRWAAEQLSTAHWYDIGAARRDLGYAPEISIEDGLERLRTWFRRGAPTGPA
ncbi:MAG: NAD-dependent epimerase/dehydratase family protein [Gammaproteobacteria bacterium]